MKPILFLLIALPFIVKAQQDKMISYTIDPAKQDIRFYWKDDKGTIFRSIQQLKTHLHNHQQKLVFAMNGGMYNADNAPVGLFIQQQQLITPTDTSTGKGNFYMKPNGVLYITKDNKAVICETNALPDTRNIKMATQSGPMLLINGTFHPAFKEGSTNLNIRNGVGILPDNKLLFAMSKEPVNFYELASWFKQHGCKNALYLDGYVSRTYLPEQNWVQTDGNFGVIIGVTVKE